MDNTKEPKSNNGLKIVIAILLLLVAISIFFVGFILFKGGDIGGVTQALQKPAEEITMDLEEFVINLQPENGRTKTYAKIKISLMYTNSKETDYLTKNNSKMRDKITNKLRAKTATEMIDVDNLEQLKIELKDEVNEGLGRPIIEDVYLTDIVIQ